VAKDEVGLVEGTHEALQRLREVIQGLQHCHAGKLLPD